MRIGYTHTSEAPGPAESGPQTTEGAPSPVTMTMALASPFCIGESPGTEMESPLSRPGSQEGVEQGCEPGSRPLGPGLAEPLLSRCCLGWAGGGPLEAQGREEGTALTVALGMGRGGGGRLFGGVAGDECEQWGGGDGASGEEGRACLSIWSPTSVAPPAFTVLSTCHLSWPCPLQLRLSGP